MLPKNVLNTITKIKKKLLTMEMLVKILFAPLLM